MRSGEEYATLRHRTILELAAMDKSDFDDVLKRILKRDAEVLGVERVNCWQLEREPPGIRCLAGYLLGPDAFESGVVLSSDDYPGYFRALIEDPIILAHDAHIDPRTREFTESYLRPKSIMSMMDVPIWVRGALWGVVCHEHVGHARHWSDAERDFAMSIGHIVSMAVEARSRADAERTARLSEFFVAVLSHDLRSPLSTIRASVDQLLRSSVDNPASTAAWRIRRNADRMARMIDQLLDFTHIRLGGKLPILRAATDLGDLCRGEVADIAIKHPYESIDLEVVGNTMGDWDPDRLQQLISNLVGNALEHGSNRERIWLHVDGTNPDSVTVRVGNRGVLPSELVPVIFEPFRQGHKSPSYRGGLGLGLFIVREIANAHSGTVVVDTSTEEIIFTVRLPRGSLRQREGASEFLELIS